MDIIIKEIIEQEVMAILNMCEPKNKSSKIKGIYMYNGEIIPTYPQIHLVSFYLVIK